MFSHLSVSESAATFRVRPSSQNLPAGAAAEKAGKNHKQLLYLLFVFPSVSPLFIVLVHFADLFFFFAVAQKNFLQSETDLNVLQGGDREVGEAFKAQTVKNF